MSVPEWVQDAIFYQIFPDRFADGDPDNNPPNVQPWGAPPTNWHFQGGDLKGVIQKFDYLLDLGVNAIYFNPVFYATSNHRYNTTDYYRIDPKLGDMQDFLNLLDLAHRHNVRVILDGVFNHCGRGFFAFNDLLENQENSPYRDWFHVKRFPVDAYSPGAASDYLAWWEIKSLPKFNTANLQVRRYLLNVARYWIERGVDGWRLDVPNEINDDTFWAEFRRVVKSANPEAYLVGEIWTADPRWVGESHFDGLLHYPLRDCIVRFLHSGTLSAIESAEKCDCYVSLYPRPNTFAMYLPLGSHDTERILTKLDGDLGKVRLAFLFQFSYPGAPGIYYGDEIGMQGGKDPDCRRAFPWDQSLWNHELRNWVKSLIAARKQYPAMRRGDYRRLLADDVRRVYAFLRFTPEQQIVVAINASPEVQNLSLRITGSIWADDHPLHNLLGEGDYRMEHEILNVELMPWSGVWIGG